ALDRLQGFAARQGVEFRPTAELLWEIANSQRRASSFPSAEVAKPAVSQTLTDALREFAAMRAREGESLLVDFIRRSEVLHRHVETVAGRASHVPANYREQLMKRLRE